LTLKNHKSSSHPNHLLTTSQKIAGKMKGPEAGALEKQNCKVLGNHCTKAGSLHQMPRKKCGGIAGPPKKTLHGPTQSNIH